jgi:hypothetical protein
VPQGWTAAAPAAPAVPGRPARPDLAGYRPGTPPPPVRPGRARPRARAVAAAELLAFLDADHPLRDKTLRWLAVRGRRPRQGEVLALNIADLGPGAPAVWTYPKQVARPSAGTALPAITSTTRPSPGIAE